ncbi:MAG: hypothetical protein WAS07_12355 [Micropruina sp.]
MVTVEQVLSASTWSALVLPRTEDTLRRLRRQFHPDVFPDPRATAVFTRLEVLFGAPEFQLRTFAGQRVQGSNAIEWTPKPGFEDLVGVADAALRTLARSNNPRFFTSRQDVASTRPGMRVNYGEAGERWWFLSAFDPLDSRTAVWVAKRLAAAITTAGEAGWIHGDIHPGTVVLMPAEHGLKLDGWWSAVRSGEKLAVAPSAKTPPRYLNGAEADPRLSVGQVAATLLAVTDADHLLQAVFARHSVSPGEPRAFFDDVDLAASELYGKRAWSPLADPTSEPI